MKSHVVRMMLGEARTYQTRLNKVLSELLIESKKRCRCINEQARQEDPCGPCLAREAVETPATAKPERPPSVP